MSRFHEGELLIQRRAGVERTAERVGRNIHPSISPDFAEFLRAQPFVVIAAADPHDDIWASLLVGGVGFARALDERRLLLAAALPGADPLAGAFSEAPMPIGILAIQPHTRGRIRINGTAQRTADGLLVSVEEAFGNCAKYITRRLPVERLDPGGAEPSPPASFLNPAQAELVRAADTFFIASHHPDRGADASHRGGTPGFVETSRDGDRVTFADYTGNRMFQTLGNIAVDGRVGLMFLDWESGTALQLSGHAEILWDEESVGRHPGAERVVTVEIAAVRQQSRAMPARWSRSPFSDRPEAAAPPQPPRSRWRPTGPA